MQILTSIVERLQVEPCGHALLFCSNFFVNTTGLDSDEESSESNMNGANRKKRLRGKLYSQVAAEDPVEQAYISNSVPQSSHRVYGPSAIAEAYHKSKSLTEHKFSDYVTQSRYSEQPQRLHQPTDNSAGLSDRERILHSYGFLTKEVVLPEVSDDSVPSSQSNHHSKPHYTPVDHQSGLQNSNPQRSSRSPSQPRHAQGGPIDGQQTYTAQYLGTEEPGQGATASDSDADYPLQSEEYNPGANPTYVKAPHHGGNIHRPLHLERVSINGVDGDGLALALYFYSVCFYLTTWWCGSLFSNTECASFAKLYFA